jgi:DNA-binding PadR family transcriptional regulator
MFNDEENGPAFAWAGGSHGDPHGGHGPHHQLHGAWRAFRESFGFGPPPAFGPRRGFGPPPGFGPRMFFWGAFGPGGRRGPNMYGRGDLKFVLLELLQERPKHGYEMIKELEGRAGGFYTPSAGAVYPTLQLMEDRGWVTSATDDGKKVYTITDAGRAALQERQAQREQPDAGPREHGPGRGHGHGREHEHSHEHEHERGPGPRGPWERRHERHSPFGGFAGPELEALGRDSIEVARLMRDAVIAARGDPAKLTQIRSIVEQTRQALSTLLQQGDSQPNPTTQEPPSEMV